MNNQHTNTVAEIFSRESNLNTNLILPRWTKIIEYYEANLRKGNGSRSEVDIAKKIAFSDYANFLFPFTSHARLCLSPTDNFENQTQFPMIEITYAGEKGFVVSYWSKMWRQQDLEKHIVEEKNLWSLLESLLLRLKIDSEN